VELIMPRRCCKHSRQSPEDKSGVHCANEYTFGKFVPLSTTPVANRLSDALAAFSMVSTSSLWMRPVMRGTSPVTFLTFHF